MVTLKSARCCEAITVNPLDVYENALIIYSKKNQNQTCHSCLLYNTNTHNVVVYYGLAYNLHNAT